MAKFRELKNSLIAGEISPSALGRTDLPQYRHACKTLKNMIPILSGGAYRRPGTLFESSFEESSFSAPRIIPFVVSKSESYAVLLMRQFGVADNVSGIIQVTHPTSTTEISTLSSMAGYHPWIDVNASYYREYEETQFAQSVDVMTLVHPNYKPQRLIRIETDSFNVEPFDQGLVGTALRDAWPYRAQNSTSITLAISAATVGVGRTVTASAAFFNPLHVGAQFKSDDGAGTIGMFRVTGYTSATSVTVEVYVALGTTGARLTWWESAWSDFRGWPRSVAYYQQRICYGGNATDRDSIWFSKTSNYDVMSVAATLIPYDGPTGNQPFQIIMSSQQLNEIQWLSSEKTLLAGTLGEEFVIQPETGSAFGCDNASVTSESHYGSGHYQPARVGEELVYVTPSNDEIKSLVFSDQQKSYVAEPIQLFFDHYPKPEFLTKIRRYRSVAWDESRKTLWCVDSAGNLFGMTRDRRIGVTAWHTHQMGGFDASLVNVTDDPSDKYGALCSGSVVSAAVVPSPVLGTNDIWLTVRRKINGAFYYHVERFMGKGISSDSSANAWLGYSGNYFVDSCVHEENGFYTSTPETYSYGVSPGPYDHLEGEILTGTASAFIGVAPETGEQGIFTLRDVAVAAGVATLSAPYPPSYDTVSYEIAIGLPFNSIVEPVRIEAGSQIGSAQGAIKRIHKLTVRFLKTLAVKIGASATLMETVIFREGSTPMGESPDLFTGDKPVDFEGDYDLDGYVYILQDKPLPFAVSAIIAEGMTYDG